MSTSDTSPWTWRARRLKEAFDDSFARPARTDAGINQAPMLLLTRT